MPFARWQATIVDEAGNILPGAEITVQREDNGTLASVFSDREGETALGNPFTAGDDGFAFFHAAGGAYRITAAKTGFSQTWRYVGIGLASEGDSGGFFAGDEAQVAAAPGDLVPVQDASDENSAKRVAASTIGAGRQSIWIPAGAWVPATTAGPTPAQIELDAAGSFNFNALEFDGGADSYAHFNVPMPKGWDGGALAYRVWWTSTATDAAGVAWGMLAGSVADGVALATSGTDVLITDNAQSVANALYVSGESAAVTIAGSPNEGDLCMFRLSRAGSKEASDTMEEAAALLGVMLYYSTNANTDD